MSKPGKKVSGTGTMIGAAIGFVIYNVIKTMNIFPTSNPAGIDGGIALTQGLICAVCVMVCGGIGKIFDVQRK